jgi:HEAT repeat protein
MDEAELFARLCDPGLSTTAEAIDLAAQRARLDAGFGPRLARTAIDTALVQDSGKALRLLDILAAISNEIRVVVIGSLLHHPDSHVRSKAVLMVGKAQQNATWVKQHMYDPDARVRANALESLWGADADQARPVFRKALEDPNNRVVGNALVGLYLIKEPACAQRIIAMAKHSDNKFRETAVWVMRRTGDPAFIPELANLAREAGGSLRSKALRALASIKVAHATPAATGKLAG